MIKVSDNPCIYSLRVYSSFTCLGNRLLEIVLCLFVLLLRRTIEMFSSSSKCDCIFLCSKASAFGAFQKPFESSFQHPDLLLSFVNGFLKNILLIFWNNNMFVIILYNSVLIMLYQKCSYTTSRCFWYGQLHTK